MPKTNIAWNGTDRAGLNLSIKLFGFLSGKNEQRKVSVFCGNPHLETERFNNAVTCRSGISSIGEASMLSFGTHLLGRLVLTLTGAMWQFLELNLGVPAPSCPSTLLAVRFAATAISMFPPIKLLRAKLGHRGTDPRQRASPPQPHQRLSPTGIGSRSPFPSDGHLD